ncbi:MAG TPA: DOMON-like domain-containing protein [Brevundimonas sp.]|nr:DOMON-like domain-containing protein [Brevundimonas sp.]
MHVLTPHPTTGPTPVDRIEVQIERLGEVGLKLRYQVFGDLDRIRPPDFEHAGRTDGLWRSTCFEAFVKPEGGEGYLECNFAGLQWAAYRFSGYREGMVEAAVEPCLIEGSARDGWLSIEIETGRLARPDLPAPDWRIGLSAVIEDIDGGISYWALAHPSDKPDFHHPDSFALTLPPLEPA